MWGAQAWIGAIAALLMGLSMLTVNGSDAAAAADAISPFEWRGVVEGFYGPPWSHPEREAQFAWMAAHGMNAYLNAPKDDAYQRANWRDPYPSEEAAVLTQEVEAATAAGVAWIPNVSPGFAVIPGRPAAGTVASAPICFACPADVDKLVAKLAPFVEAGSPAVAVSFDDVLPFSPHVEDWRAYGVGAGAAAAMQRDLLAQVHERLGVPVITVLTEYAGVRDSPYLQAIRAGDGLDPAVEVLWTGTAVIAERIRGEDAATYARLVGREKVIVWDNYPAHDTTGPVLGRPPARLFLGPYEGRDPALDVGASGVLVNPMQLPRASRIPLATVAEYLTDPAGYDQDAAWERAVGEAGEGADVLAQNSRSSRLDRTESVEYSVAVGDFTSGLDDGAWPAALGRLRAETEREAAVGGELAGSVPALAEEVAPWTTTMALHAELTTASADAAAAMQPALEAGVVPSGGVGEVVVSGRAAPARPTTALARLAALAPQWARVRGRAAVTHGDRFTFLIDKVYVGENSVDRFLTSTWARVLRRLLPVTVAGRRLIVTVGGDPVPLAPDGTFSTSVPGGTPVEVVATDGAGGRTRLTV